MRHLIRRAGLTGSALLLVVAAAATPASADPPPAAGGKPFFQMPFPCGLQIEVNPFGHAPALDMFRVPRSLTTGTPVLASADGVVVQAEFQDYGGNAVQIRHSGDWYTVQIHLQRIDVRVGQSVRRGQQIGTAGGTGSGANTPHVHYEQSHDDNGDGFVDWGKDHGERYPVEFNGVVVEPPPATSRTVTSANCLPPADQIGVFRGGNPGSLRLDNNYDGASDIVINYGRTGDMPISGDWDNNGAHGLGVFRPSEGRFYLDQNNDGATDNWVNWGDGRDRPVSGDWDGEGGDGIGVFRAATGEWFLDNWMDGTTDYHPTYGQAGDFPVAGNWDGLGGDGIGAYRPGNRTFYLDDWVDGTTDHTFQYGQAGDYPFAGDFDSDGKDGVAVFRPSDGYIYIDNDLNGITDRKVKYGAEGDRPFSRKRG
ncbi:M23 family metallopeptidase [Actinoplanes sp. NPDC024001]|uniref:M23 family metallopeptidase n=1 Tax=Actinoplanes sp. NPDC024001 TaxID=3154598 RepID=UPI00340F4CA4